MRVLLIAGGWSTEREVSLSGSLGVEASLIRLGHEVIRLDPRDRFDQLATEAKGCDFAFILMHGSPGEDGLIQAVLEAADIPFQGAGCSGSYLALHKAASKQIFRMAGLPTPDWEFLPTPPDAQWKPKLPYPIFVKDNTGGSSLDMALANDEATLRNGMDILFKRGGEVLLERSLKGVELTCGVVGDAALPPILIRPLRSEAFFDYQSKYESGGAEEICPAPVSKALYAQLQEQALAAHNALGLTGCSRADFILEDETLWLLEVNTIPGMTPTSLLPQSAAAAGMDFDALINRLIELGMEEQTKRAKA